MNQLEKEADNLQISPDMVSKKQLNIDSNLDNNPALNCKDLT